MKKLIVFIAAALVSLAQAHSAEQIANVYGRHTVSLNGTWKAIADPQYNGLRDFHKAPLDVNASYFADRSYNDDREVLVEYDYDVSLSLRVPGDWNSQCERLYYYEGNLWYRTRFDYAAEAGRRVFLYFGAVNYESEVALNRTILGVHKGGFTPFNYEVTDVLKEGVNSLVVRVDNARRPEAVPTETFDWWNYGGITRDVLLVTVPETFIRDYGVALDPSDPRYLKAFVQLDGSLPEQTVTLAIPELKLRKSLKTDASGYGELRFKATPERWCPENPKLYAVTLSSDTDTVSDKIGFRTISTDGGRILLNGKQVFFKGVAVHEETLGSNPGRISTAEQARELLSVAKDMNCNFVRLAHYPHCEQMLRAADEMGLMVWDEIPCYWAVEWGNPETYANAEAQLSEMISRDRNRASVVVWSVANETPRGAVRLDFLSRLIARARALDGTRLVSAALLTRYIDKESSRITVDDELLQYTDLISFNEYVGWYDGVPAHCAEMKWEFDVQKPVVITEYGAGARYGLHGPETHRFTEEQQEKVFEGQVDMFTRIPNLSGTCPWVLKDFRSPRRLLVGVQDEFNRKGLVDERGNRKKAFYVMKKFYESL